ncbi:MAG TPA: FCD domain-containing protein [Lacisediminihabitans sp.]|uniref:FadR/GntR family transcriptional regulator n=1 Tax=Lacisediminihabitans sp. TaxID=2787631 RepID=UPI002ED9BF0F
MPRRALNRPSLTQLTADSIISLVQDQGLREGDPIPSAAEMAEELGVSRTVIREAVAELSGQGLLKRQQGSQSVISVPGSTQLERLMRLRFAVRGHDLEQVQEIRESIEVAAARLAAERATDEEIQGIRRKMEALRAATDVGTLYRADVEFHREVVGAAHNDVMEMLVDALSPLLDKLLRQVWQGWVKNGEVGVHELVESHAAIVECIAVHDGNGAAEAMRDNLGKGLLGFQANVV